MQRHSVLAVVAVLGATAACTDAPFAPEPAGRHAPTPPRFTLGTTVTPTDLGTLGGANSVAQAINDNGQVVGTSDTTGGQPRPFIWTVADGMKSLGHLGAGGGEAAAINNAGQVVGFSFASVGGGSQLHAFLWTAAGGMQDLGTLGGTTSRAYGINNAGQVVGESTTLDGVTHAFRWVPNSTGIGGTMQDLGVLATTGQSSARAINDAGQVVGWSNVDAAPGSHPVIWSATNAIEYIGTLGGNYGIARDVNLSGQVVGVARTTTGLDVPFFWQSPGPAQPLSAVSGFTAVDAYGINDAGQIVGNANLFGVSVAYLWSAADGRRDLTPPPGSSYDIALGVNNNAAVVGQSWFPSLGVGHATLWQFSTPAPARLPVTIDVWPRCTPNVVHLTGSISDPCSGELETEVKIKVAVLSTPTLDARQLDAATITLGDGRGAEAPVATRPDGTLRLDVRDVNKDRRLDVVYQFSRATLIANGDLTTTTTQLVLLGALTDGRLVRGTDAAVVVP